MRPSIWRIAGETAAYYNRIGWRNYNATTPGGERGNYSKATLRWLDYGSYAGGFERFSGEMGAPMIARTFFPIAVRRTIRTCGWRGNIGGSLNRDKPGKAETSG